MVWSLGQSQISLEQGITDNYVEDIEADTYSLYIEQMFQSWKQPDITVVPLKKERLGKDKVDEYCKENNIDPSLSTGQQRADRAIKAQRKQEGERVVSLHL